MRSLYALSALCLISSAACADCWQPVPETSKLSFTATQAGAPLEGTFHHYDARLCLDAGSGSLKVSVQTASVDTQLPELDEALRGADFFDVTHWPAATFQSDSLKSLGGGRYQLNGKLTVRDQTRDVSLPFTWTPAADGKSAKLEGQFSLKRLDYKIGQGQWADTSWVGDKVDLAFVIVFKPAAKP